ncbi:MAG: hypothetical protein J5829_02495 [Lachnospiraceae bacterium]|nr:hypothetical protein [Lachnospiraceae bacterium]
MTGIFKTNKKDGTVYYRASITYKGKHISLGSSESVEKAELMYRTAVKVVKTDCVIEEYQDYAGIPFKKYITLINFRDNGIYIKNPIVLRRTYFSYYLSPDIELKFDMEDLFYYSEHAIMKRGRHLFVTAYGLQENIMSRYGIGGFAVPGKDYIFENGDDTDMRYSNIRVINRFRAVRAVKEGLSTAYEVKIHLDGDWKIGRFPTEVLACVAYNKALDEAKKHSLKPRSSYIYIDELNARQYAQIYSVVELPQKYLEYLDQIH